MDPIEELCLVEEKRSSDMLSSVRVWQYVSGALLTILFATLLAILLYCCIGDRTLCQKDATAHRKQCRKTECEKLFRVHLNSPDLVVKRENSSESNTSKSMQDTPQEQVTRTLSTFVSITQEGEEEEKVEEEVVVVVVVEEEEEEEEAAKDVEEKAVCGRGGGRRGGGGGEFGDHGSNHLGDKLAVGSLPESFLSGGLQLGESPDPSKAGGIWF